MALIGSYSVSGSFSEITLSKQYDTVDDLLIQIPNNTAGAIQAGDIRDSVFSLWQKIEGVSASASVTVSVDYNRSNPSTVAVGGLSIGSTFSGTIQDVLDRILYPYVGPGGSLTSWSIKEYGDPSGYSFNLSYTAVVNSNPLTSIVVDGVSKPLTPLSGLQPVISTHSSINPSSNPGTGQTYTMTISDGISTTTKNTTVTWRNRIYWGRIDLTPIGNPNLTTNPGSASMASSLVTSTLIRNLSGAGANGSAFGNELSTSKSKTYTNINGSGWYLIFAWPSNMVGSFNPIFTVNGLPNTAFTRLKTNWAFTNQFGFSGSDYEVWISNTLQNSPLTVVVS